MGLVSLDANHSQPMFSELFIEPTAHGTGFEAHCVKKGWLCAVPADPSEYIVGQGKVFAFVDDFVLLVDDANGCIAL